MIARKCDRCGALFEEVDGCRAHVQYGKVDRVRSWSPDSKDLCQKCNEEFLCWINMEENK